MQNFASFAGLFAGAKIRTFEILNMRCSKPHIMTSLCAPVIIERGYSYVSILIFCDTKSVKRAGIKPLSNSLMSGLWWIIVT